MSCVSSLQVSNWHPVQDLISSLLCILQNQVGSPLVDCLLISFILECLLVCSCGESNRVPHLNTCSSFPCRWFRKAGSTFIKVPLLGAVSVLALCLSPFCLTFSVIWGYYRLNTYAWIGQDILVRQLNLFLSPMIFTIAFVQIQLWIHRASNAR